MNSFIQNHIFRNVDSFSLGLFRAIFGAFMLIEMMVYASTGFYEGSIISPQFNFSYDYLGFISPGSPAVMNGLHFIMAIAAILIMVGLFFRWACVVFFICFTYFLLCCKGHFNNHFYLFSLFSFLLIFTNADRSFTLNKKEKVKDKIIPIWQLNMLKVQVFVVYFFGGIAKLNSDWLVKFQPMKKSLQAFSKGGFLESDVMVMFFSYGGFLFDLLIGFLLMYKPTRKLAALGVIFFNVTNSIIYDDIGIFPFVMLSTLILFFPPESDMIKKIKSLFVNQNTRVKASTAAAFSPNNKLVLIGLGCYFAFQFLFPLRHHLITDNIIWSGISRNFSWHMKVQDRGMEEVSLLIINKDGGETIPFSKEQINKRINNLQIQTMVQTPSMVWQFSNWLEKRLNYELKKSKGKTFDDLEIYSRIKTSFNGREPQYIIDPSVDLTQVKFDPLGENSWIMPVLENDGE